MKKSIIINSNNLTSDIDNQSIETSEEMEQLETENSDANYISLSSLISYSFIILLIVSIVFKFIFPSFDSLQANLLHKKIGKSVVYSYFNLIKNSKLDEAMKLIDTSNGEKNLDSMLNSLRQSVGTTDIIDCNVLDVEENDNYSVVNTVISYMENGSLMKKDQSFLVNNTPNGWKISLNGVIKKFRLENLSTTYNNCFSISPVEIEYCVEGINLKLYIKNYTYKKYNIDGTLTLNINNGSSYNENINSVLKPRVNYSHNVLFNGSSGEPSQLVINLPGKNWGTRVLPIKIAR